MAKAVSIKLDVRDPDLSRIREIAQAAREGKIVGFPTETVYGIGAPMSVPNVSETLARIKKREAEKPFSYHIGDWSMLGLLQVRRTPAFRYLSKLFWPGPLTLLALDATGKKIGLRFPKHRVATALFNTTGEPFIATSANRAGSASPRTAAEAMEQLGDQIDILLDAGVTEFKTDSTVVDLTEKSPTILRQGAEAEAVERAIRNIAYGKFPRKRILFVCTGNSCRSPMAEAWLKGQLQRAGLSDEIEVVSCGVAAREGAAATPEAVLVMKNRETDLLEHRTRACSREDMVNADLIFAMSKEHHDFIAGLVPECAIKVRVLNIPDPIGMIVPVYEEVMRSMEKKLKDAWNEIVA